MLPFMPQDAICWTKSRNFESTFLTPNLSGDENDSFLLSQDRLSITTVTPDSWDDCNNNQKRLVLYYQCFRYFFGVGRSGVRVELPPCIVCSIRMRYADQGDLEAPFAGVYLGLGGNVRI